VTTERHKRLSRGLGDDQITATIFLIGRYRALPYLSASLLDRTLPGSALLERQSVLSGVITVTLRTTMYGSTLYSVMP